MMTEQIEQKQEMKVEHKEVDYCKLEVLYQADEDVVVSKRDEAIAELRKIHVPGFRKGKAPDYAIRSRCKKQVNDWIAREMGAHAYDDVVFETGIKPIGYPKITEVKLKGNKFSCSMTILKKPDFELQEYSGFKIPKPDIDRDVPKMVESSIMDIRTRLGEITPYEEEDFVADGDQITMSFEATIDGEEFEGSTVEGELYTVGDNRYHFDKELIGMQAGDEREFDITFPEDVPTLGGKTAHFKVTVHMGSKRNPHPIDETFFKLCGVEDIQELKQKLTGIATERVRATELNAVRKQVIERLVSGHDFKVPEFLRDTEAQHLKAQWQVTSELSDKEKEMLNETAQKNVKLSLILDSIREMEPDAVLSDAEAHGGIAQRLEIQGKDPKKFMVEAEKNGSLIGMISAMRDEFTVQWVINNSEIVE
jgi:trigger factor